MIVVYQSLESVGHKETTGHSVLSGNSFKHKAQTNAGRVYDLDNADRKLTFPVPHYDFATKKIVGKDMEVEFATGLESKAFSNTFKSGQDANELLEFLSGVIDTIVKSTMNRTSTNGGFTSRPPTIIVLGELYGEELKGKTIRGYDVVYGMNPTGDSRHRFTVLKNKHSQIDDFDLKVHRFDTLSDNNKNEKAICMTLTIMGWLMAFVHIPNHICGDAASVVEYLKFNAMRSTGREELDLLIGDTNQKSSGFMPSALKGKLGGQDWVSSIHGGEQELVGYGGHSTFSISGTNSGFDTHFDIACTHHAVAKIKDNKVVGSDTTDPTYDPAFVFHGLTDKYTQLNGKAYAYSDHNGVIIEVLRRKDVQAYNAHRRNYRLCRSCNGELTGIETLTGIHLNCRTLQLTYAPKEEGSLKRVASQDVPDSDEPSRKKRKPSRDGDV